MEVQARGTGTDHPVHLRAGNELMTEGKVIHRLDGHWESNPSHGQKAHLILCRRSHLIPFNLPSVELYPSNIRIMSSTDAKGRGGVFFFIFFSLLLLCYFMNNHRINASEQMKIWWIPPDASNVNHFKITSIKYESNLMILDIIFIRLKKKFLKDRRRYFGAIPASGSLINWLTSDCVTETFRVWAHCLGEPVPLNHCWVSKGASCPDDVLY